MDLIKTIPYSKNLNKIKPMWNKFVKELGEEGLVVVSGGKRYKIKPVKTIDAVIIGIDRTGKTYKTGMFGSLYLGVIDRRGVLFCIGKMSGGDEAWKRKMRKLLKKITFKVIDDTAFVKLQYIIEVHYGETTQVNTFLPAFRINKDKTFSQISIPPEYRKVTPFSIRHGLKFVRDRPDKKPKYIHISANQLPEMNI